MTENYSKPPFGKLSTLIYATIFGSLQQIARDSGYSLAVHGSMQRDFDLIAVPWTNEAIDAEDLVIEFVGALQATSRSEVEQKPHGRLAWFITLSCGMGVDISVMPKIKDK